MTDAISNYSRIALNDTRLREGAKKLDSSADTQGSASSPSPAPVAAVAGDQLQLSEVALQAMNTEVFDQAKVDAIKLAIQKGDYPLDARRIAESFYSIEQMIKG